MRDENALLEHVAGGGRIDGPEQMSPGYRAEIVRVMTVLVDSELAAAAGFAEAINRLAPGLAERQAMVRLTGEKLVHAGKVLELMRPFGVVPDLYLQSHAWPARVGRGVDLGVRRIPGDKRLNVFHYPLESWWDVLLVDLLVGDSLAHQLRDLSGCSYAPLDAELPFIATRAALLAGLAEPLLAAAIERAESPRPAQAALDYWWPRACATFGRQDPDSERFDLYRRYGLRKEPNRVLLERWAEAMRARLGRLGLAVANT